ncbi:MAG: hypothetical protein KatS3mg068_1056 [Candidatus Sericytochromatia bacterium]|nr:MAG: hypothetical protein KatS3mg068_1056 [Candidatus Sericytochromatia bacterium]
MKRLVSLFLISFTFSLPAYSKPDVKVKLENQKIILKDNKEIYESADKAQPGDTLVYRIVLTNVGDSEARKLQPVGNIPEGTTYIKEKYLYEALFSLDGKTFDKEPKIKVREGNKEVLKPATPDMYKKIKWLIDKPLKPNQTLVISYKVKLK